jgi:CheY-like chemotaxis protein
MQERTEEQRKPFSILVVDDEPAVRDLVKEVLESGGYEVLTAGNGREAMKCLRRNIVDLVITDLVMPEQEGIETIRAIRRGQPGMKILAMSGSAAPHLSTARKLGAQDSIQKPFSLESLLAKVEQLLAA